MKICAFVFVSFFLSATCSATDRPNWSFDAKGGRFKTQLDEWSTYYGDDRSELFSVSAAYKVLRFTDIGLEAGRIHDRGVGQLPLNGTTSGDVTIDFYPVHAFMTFRALFSERQWVVPYVGGGWTRMYYKSKVAGGQTSEGSVDGRHVRAGLQILLDPLGRADAANLRRYGIEHSYLIFEGQKITAKDSTTGLEVGGTSSTFGLLLEY